MAHLRHAGGLSECLFTGVDRQPSVSDLSCKKNDRDAPAQGLIPSAPRPSLPTRLDARNRKLAAAVGIELESGRPRRPRLSGMARKTKAEIRESPKSTMLRIVRAMIIEAGRRG
jgi:hypothetical protein